MKRLSLLFVALSILTAASGCCCGLLHGCNSCCGYPSACGSCGYGPVYPVAPSCPSCPTCPSGGCGVGGPVIQGSFYDANGAIHLGSTSPASTPGAPTVAAADPIPNF